MNWGINLSGTYSPRSGQTTPCASCPEMRFTQSSEKGDGMTCGRKESVCPQVKTIPKQFVKMR